MSAASHRMGDKSDRPLPRRKAGQLSPELDEVLRMLKALEDQPEGELPGSDKSR
jgi:hypothetical protein